MGGFFQGEWSDKVFGHPSASEAAAQDKGQSKRRGWVLADHEVHVASDVGRFRMLAVIELTKQAKKLLV
jgi:hypothetical protein